MCHQVDELTLENKALDRQLLEAVSQKLQLSEQLDAWQVSTLSTLLAVMVVLVALVGYQNMGGRMVRCMVIY